MKERSGAKTSLIWADTPFERAEAIRKQWIDYFSITTRRRASMTAKPR
jgi:hypothetical protein